MKLWKTLFQPAQILLPLFAGMFVPSAAKFDFLIKWLLIVMLLNACLGIRLDGLKPRRFHWLVLGANILIGLLSWIVPCMISGANTDLAKALFFTGITPAATAAPVMIPFLGGSVAVMLTGFLISDLGVSIALIGLLPLVTGNFDVNFVWNVLSNIFLVMGLPLVLSRILLKFWPGLMEFSRRKIMPHALWAWSVMLFVLGAMTRVTFDEEQSAGAASLILLIAAGTFAVCVVSFAVGRLLGRGNPSFTIEASQMLGQKNTMFTIFLALKFAGPVAALGPLVYIIWHNSWNACQLFFIERRRQREVIGTAVNSRADF